MLADRIGDVSNETNPHLLPIDGYQNKPLVTLEKAVVPLHRLFDPERLQMKVKVAKQRCKHPLDGLSVDESAAIMLYTFEEPQREQSFYFVLNQTLRRENRDLLKPWFLYLKLFLTALHQLPPISDQLLRGVKGHLTDQYAAIETATWWGVSSCTKSINTFHTETIFGYKGPRTLFFIRSSTGRSIQNHSYIPEEEEIILLPGRRFRVKAKFDPGDLVQMIQLEETHESSELCPSPGIAEWRRRIPGINAEGICRNSKCCAYEQEVIIRLGFQTFDILVEMSSKSRCPMCSKFVQISRVSFHRCRWRWHGLQQKETHLHEQPMDCEGNWKEVDRWGGFIVAQPNIRWLQLVFEARAI